MAMTLRLTEEETEALRIQAEREGRSMNEVARVAIVSYINERTSRLQSAIQRVAVEDAELLHRLSQ